MASRPWSAARHWMSAALIHERDELAFLWMVFLTISPRSLGNGARWISPCPKTWRLAAIRCHPGMDFARNATEISRANASRQQRVALVIRRLAEVAEREDAEARPAVETTRWGDVPTAAAVLR